MTVSLVAGVITFLWHPRVERLRMPILLFDAAGLGLFAVSGIQAVFAAAAAVSIVQFISAWLLKDPQRG